MAQEVNDRPDGASSVASDSLPDGSESRESPARPRSGSPVVVGIGASAGGLDAFKRFFGAMPSPTGLAFVLVQHLDPTHESLMADLLGRYTDMPVVQVEDEMPVEADHVYIIPPDRYLMISEGILRLTRPTERRGMRMPIDFFLISLAEDLRERAIGIILSGTASDGTLGIKAVKAQGGVTMVQDPKTAQYDGMPRSAMATGMVDYVLPVDQMPDTLVRYAAFGATTKGLYRYYDTFSAGDSRVYIQPGTFLKLREVTVSYQAPNAFVNRWLKGAKDLRVSFSGRNLWVKTDYWSYDPEFNNFGNTNFNRFIDLAPFPTSRQFFFSVDLGY